MFRLGLEAAKGPNGTDVRTETEHEACLARAFVWEVVSTPAKSLMSSGMHNEINECAGRITIGAGRPIGSELASFPWKGVPSPPKPLMSSEMCNEINEGYPQNRGRWDPSRFPVMTKGPICPK